MKTLETQSKLSRRHFLSCSVMAGATATHAVLISGAIAAQAAGAQEPGAVTRPTKIYANASAKDPQKNAQEVNPVQPARCRAASWAG